MGKPLVKTGLAIVAVGVAAALLTALPTRGQSPATPRSPYKDGKPDLNGIWQALTTANWDLQDHGARMGPVPALGAVFSVPPGAGVVVGNEIPYQPWAAAKKKENAAKWVTEDPEMKCYLPGVPRVTYEPYPFQIAQGQEHVLITYEFTTASRMVYMKDVGDAPFDSWLGWSKGRWEGETLVVDVTGFNGRTWLDRAGNFTSDALHVVERYTPIDADHLNYEATIDDSKVFTRPWKIQMMLYRRKEPNLQLLEYKCVEFVEELMYGPYSKKASTN